jgi:2-oxoisovalerate ferredoxin oxidoreductase beta subunit
MGEPIKMAETIAQLDGPVYVERVALYDAKQRVKAKKAIKKGLRMQVENRGFAFVEVLAECPTHLKLNPSEAETWVKENMTPIFPLGLKKDLEPEPWFEMGAPNFDPQSLMDKIEATSEESERFATTFPEHIHPEDISLKLAGAGGDGAQTAAMLITRVAISENYDSTHIPSYGPESRGGTSYADVHIAKTEVLSPASPNPHILIAFNAPSLAKFGPAVQPGGTIIYDSSVINEPPALDESIKQYGVPFAQIAMDLGKVVVKNVVALGALQAATNIFPEETFLAGIRAALQHKCAMIPLNEEAFHWGQKAFARLSEA